MSNKLYDLSILYDYVSGDKDFMRELIHIFIETAPRDTKLLNDTCKSSDYDSAVQLAHKLKSSIRTIGITSLTDLIYEIEMDARNRVDINTICDKISRFNETLLEVIKLLKEEGFA